MASVRGGLRWAQGKLEFVALVVCTSHFSENQTSITSIAWIMSVITEEKRRSSATSCILISGSHDGTERAELQGTALAAEGATRASVLYLIIVTSADSFASFGR